VKVVVCGSRDWTDAAAIADRLDKLPWPFIIEGGAEGADNIAGNYAVRRGLPHATVPANWLRYGKRAGHLRNGWMLDLQPDLVIAFQRNGSRGTQNTIDEARRRGIPVEVIEG
jgi:hypothetical protein